MLSSPGIGSGLDVNGIVSQLMLLEQRPLTMLNSKEAKQQAQLSAYGSLKSALSSFQDSVKALTKPSLFNGFKATLATPPGSTAVAAVSAAAGAAAGSHQIEVQALAQAQKIKSEAFVSTDTTLGSGTLTIEFGTYNEDGSFTGNTGKTPQTISIDPSHSSLTGIRDAINTADAGVTASIINDGSGHRLVIASKDTGLSNALKITVNDKDGNPADNAGLSQLAYDASTGGIAHLTETVAAQNAVMVIDGITINKPSNTISDALGGVTFNLLKADPGTATTLSVEQDKASVETAVNAFIKVYNELEKTIGGLSRYDAAGQQASVLTGDSTVRAIQNRLRSILTAAQPNGSEGLTALSQLGISFQKDGTLALDSSKLSAILADPGKNIAAFFSGQVGENGAVPLTGFATQLDQLIENMIKSDGLIDSRMDGISITIRDIGKQRDALGRRLEDVEKRIRAQFTALDTMIASMSQTSSFLQQQLANLPKLNTEK